MQTTPSLFNELRVSYATGHSKKHVNRCRKRLRRRARNGDIKAQSFLHATRAWPAWKKAVPHTVVDKPTDHLTNKGLPAKTGFAARVKNFVSRIFRRGVR